MGGCRSPRSVSAPTSGREDAATDAGYEACDRRGPRLGRQRLRHGDQLPRPEERARRRPRARGGVRRGPRRARRGLRLDQGRLPAARRRGPAPGRAGTCGRRSSSPGLAPADEIAQGCHCIAPGYLRDQIARSRENLGLDDDRPLLPPQRRDAARARSAATLPRSAVAGRSRPSSEAVADGRIAAWGLATWDGLRVPPEHPEHLSLAAMLDLAEEVGGAGHHFRAVQLPGQSRRWRRPSVYRSQEIGRGRASRPSPAAAELGTRGVRLGVDPPGPPGRGELPEEIAEAFPAGADPARSRRSSSPVRRRD